MLGSDSAHSIEGMMLPEAIALRGMERNMATGCSLHQTTRWILSSWRDMVRASETWDFRLPFGSGVTKETN